MREFLMDRSDSLKRGLVPLFGVIEMSDVVFDPIRHDPNTILLFSFAPRYPLIAAGIVGVLSGIHLILAVGCNSKVTAAVVECLFLVYVVYLHSFWVAHDEAVHEHSLPKLRNLDGR